MFLKPSGRPFPNSTSYKTVLTCYLIKLYTSFCLISWVSGSRSDHWNEPTVPFFWHADASYKCRTTWGYDFWPNGNGMNMPSCDYRQQIFGPKISGPFTPSMLAKTASTNHKSKTYVLKFWISGKYFSRTNSNKVPQGPLQQLYNFAINSRSFKEVDKASTF